MNELIEHLQNKELVWQGTATSQNIISGLTTGYEELDNKLNGGFLKNGVTEIQTPTGIGELRLLIPSLQHAIDAHRMIVFIAPLGLITPEALASFGIDLTNVLIVYPSEQKDALWAAEQCLRGGSCHSVLMWTQQALEIHQVKRLQVSSYTGNSKLFLLRTHKAESLSLPFDLSLSLQAHGQGVNVKVNKRKGGWPSKAFTVNMANHWPSLTVQKIPGNLIHFPNVQTG